MSESTETPACHWEQVQRQWKWEWASYRPHPGLYWTADGPEGTTGLLEDATLAAEPPGTHVDLSYGARWEKVSGTGTDVVVGTADLPEGVVPAGAGWRLAEVAHR